MYIIYTQIVEKFIIDQENFDSTLIPVSSVVTLAKVAQQLVDKNNKYINLNDLQIGLPTFSNNLTLNGNLTINGTLVPTTALINKTNEITSLSNYITTGSLQIGPSNNNLNNMIHNTNNNLLLNSSAGNVIIPNNNNFNVDKDVFVNGSINSMPGVNISMGYNSPSSSVYLTNGTTGYNTVYPIEFNPNNVYSKSDLNVNSSLSVGKNATFNNLYVDTFRNGTSLQFSIPGTSPNPSIDILSPTTLSTLISKCNTLSAKISSFNTSINAFDWQRLTRNTTIAGNRCIQ
jgi:hypothetical protein